MVCFLELKNTNGEELWDTEEIKICNEILNLAKFEL